jgi:quercetin dioxygenase-like cupin family protein
MKSFEALFKERQMADSIQHTETRPRRFETLGILMNFHAFPGEVSDKFCMVECVVPPGLGAPPNSHAGETEVFFVPEGEVDFMVEGETTHAKAGDSVHIPDGAVHAFTAIGATPAQVMIINVPGQMHDGFFTELGSPIHDDRTQPAPMDGPPDVAHVVQVAEKWGMTIMAPAAA